jgi:hypothetical protein
MSTDRKPVYKQNRNFAGWFVLSSALALAMMLVKLSAQDYEFSTIAGLPGVNGIGVSDGTNNDARFDSPASLAMDSGGNIFVADFFSGIIRKMTPMATNWVVKTIAGTPYSFGSADGTNSDAGFNKPSGVAVDAQGNLYVADNFNHTIRRIAPSGTNWVVKTIAGLAGTDGIADGTNSNARFYYPRGVAVDAGGNLFVADTANDTIRKITPVGTNWVVTTIAGLARTNGVADGTNSNARFFQPAGIAVDTNGDVFVSDYSNNTIRRLKRSGTNWVVSTLAGLADYNSGSSDGTNRNAGFAQPLGLAVGADSNLYVADFNNDLLRKLTPAGANWVVTTLGGQAGITGSTNGTGTNALFNLPAGIAVDNAGNVYVADTQNNTIRKGRILATQVSPPPVFELIAQSNGIVVFTWSAVLGRSYQAQYKTNLSQTSWIDSGGVRVATNITLRASDSIGTDRQRFYRIVLLP